MPDPWTYLCAAIFWTKGIPGYPPDIVVKRQFELSIPAKNLTKDKHVFMHV